MAGAPGWYGRDRHVFDGSGPADKSRRLPEGAGSCYHQITACFIIKYEMAYEVSSGV